MMLVNRWQTRGGKYFYELYKDDMGFTYKSESGGGNLGNVSEDQAYQYIVSLLIQSDRNYKIQKPSSKAEDGRNRIEKTKNLSLDERVSVIDNITTQLGINTAMGANARADEIWQHLENLGYLPMMFSAACRIWASKHRNNG